MKQILLTPNSYDFAKKLPSPRKIIIKQFPDGESYIRIPPVEGKEAILFHRCYPQQDTSLIQLFLILQTLKEKNASRIRAVVPYLPYARQDKIFLEGEALSSRAVCRLIQKSGCDELITFDCHFLKKPGVFKYAGLRIRNLSLSQKLLSYFKSKLPSPKIISPDEGASYFLARERDAGVMKKTRGSYTEGKTIYRKPQIEFALDLRGRDVVIVDDMISTGSTMLKAVEICRKLGAGSIYCGASHGLFLNDSLKKLKRAGAREIVVSNSIKTPASKIDITELLKWLC